MKKADQWLVETDDGGGEFRDTAEEALEVLAEYRRLYPALKHRVFRVTEVSEPRVRATVAMQAFLRIGIPGRRTKG